MRSYSQLTGPVAPSEERVQVQPTQSEPHQAHSSTKQSKPPHDHTSCPEEVITKPWSLLRSHSKAGSIYTLSRVSFTSQITQLTSIPLPQAWPLAEAIRSIPTATGALSVLEDAAYQIQRWIGKATDVLNGLDADGEIDWAVAAGRGGIHEVNKAIDCFEVLINVYVDCVGDLQLRNDADQLPRKLLNHALDEIEQITDSWQNIKKTLQNVKMQVELSMEWEELHSSVFRQIANELENLYQTVFELEEQRHRRRSLSGKEVAASGGNPGKNSTLPKMNSQCSDVNTLSLTTPPRSDNIFDMQDDQILALFARMEPLKASLDFLPMRYAGFQSRATSVFPSACEDLEKEMRGFELRWSNLVADSDTLRKELAEDKWVNVFHHAAGQAKRMCGSVKDSIASVNKSLQSDIGLVHSARTQRKIGSYETKKAHYCPAITQIISITRNGLNERLTINGEIVRLQAELYQHWSELQAAIVDLDSRLKIYANNNECRNSTSSVFSSSLTSWSSPCKTLMSSPPSSVSALSTKSSPQHLRSSAKLGSSLTSTPASNKTRRYYCNSPMTPGTPSRLTETTLSGRMDIETSNHSKIPVPATQPKASVSVVDRPRWNYSTKVTASDANKKSNTAFFTAPAASSGLPVLSIEASPLSPFMRFGQAQSSSKSWVAASPTSKPRKSGL